MDQALPSDNRRGIYRHAPSPVMEPRISIVHRGTRVTARSVIDINARGARIAFGVDSGAGYRPGEEVVLVAQAPGLDGCVDIRGRIVFSALRDGRILVGVVFLQLPDVAERSDGAFFSVFNRRAAERADDGTGAAARLVQPALPDREPPVLRVVNHSAGGIGFMLERELDQLLHLGDDDTIALELPGEDGVQRFQAHVCHRAQRTDAVYYGCRFESAA